MHGFAPARWSSSSPNDFRAFVRSPALDDLSPKYVIGHRRTHVDHQVRDRNRPGFFSGPTSDVLVSCNKTWREARVPRIDLCCSQNARARIVQPLRE